MAKSWFMIIKLCRPNNGWPILPHEEEGEGEEEERCVKPGEKGYLPAIIFWASYGSM